jgi:hypothetical protein
VVTEGGPNVKRLLFETDWLASRPVFYNEITGQASHNINDVIDYANFELIPEGINNFLDFGYSVLEQTPVKDVKFLRYSSKLWMDDQGNLSVEYLDDPVEQRIDYRVSEVDVIDLLRERIHKWEQSVDGEIIIPTSGGYDSRLLNLLVEAKARLRTFSYGVSENQTESFEVIYAQLLSQKLGTCWEQITLGDFHQYFDDWDQLFGVSTHAHGMYHFEFYNKILPKVKGGNPLLSGIIGDAWAGGVEIEPINSPDEVRQLGYTHGLRADSSQSQFKSDCSLLQNYFEKNHDRLHDMRMRIVESMRFKIILLSYLMSVPLSLGFNPWSPYLDLDVAMAMLNLPAVRRQGKLWQEEFFRKQDVDFKSAHIQTSRQNNLSYQAMRRVPLKPLDARLLAAVIKPAYVEWINRETAPQLTLGDRCESFLRIPKLGRTLRNIGLHTPRLNAYRAYLTLKPIESLLRKKSQALSQMAAHYSWPLKDVL